MILVLWVLKVICLDSYDLSKGVKEFIGRSVEPSDSYDLRRIVVMVPAPKSSGVQCWTPDEINFLVIHRLVPGGNKFKTKNFCMKDTGTILIYEDKVVMKGLYLARTVSTIDYSPLSSFSFPSEEGYSSSSSLTQSSLELSVSSPEQCRIYPVSEYLD